MLLVEQHTGELVMTHQDILLPTPLPLLLLLLSLLLLLLLLPPLLPR
jgi:hypothetical protein